jgi:hypothetical protein
VLLLQMRLPYMAASLFLSGLASCGIAGIVNEWSEPWLLRVTAPRVAALVAGLALDAARRLAFMRQQQHQETGPSVKISSHSTK